MKKGFTLVELLITVTLFTIVITIAIGGFTNAIRTQRQVSSLISAQSNVSLALEQMARAIRTGYLFCNTYKNTNTGAGTGNPIGASSVCGCTLATAPGAPVGSWSCNALDFYDSQSTRVIFYRDPATGALMEANATSSSGGPAGGQALTGDTVRLKWLTFQLYGQVENDNTPPRITISMGVAPSSSDPVIASSSFPIQTTVSARTIDCAPAPNASSSPQC